MTSAPAFTVWLTGLSGSGKSTLARGLSAHFTALGLRHERLDGDELRLTLCRDLGFSKEDRDENVRRIAQRARELNEAQEIAIVAAIAPYREARAKARLVCGRFVGFHWREYVLPEMDYLLRTQNLPVVSRSHLLTFQNRAHLSLARKIQRLGVKIFFAVLPSTGNVCALTAQKPPAATASQMSRDPKL